MASHVGARASLVENQRKAFGTFVQNAIDILTDLRMIGWAFTKKIILGIIGRKKQRLIVPGVDRGKKELS